jgi:hypothetical protein
MPKWEFVVDSGASKARLLMRDGVPVAKFYAERLSVDEMKQVAAVLNRAGAL